MSDFEVTGNGADPVADSLNYRLIYTTITQVQPESEVTYSFDVTVHRMPSASLVWTRRQRLRRSPM